jgi:hypothetical protein
LALIATASKCNSNPGGDTASPQWTFSAYCRTLALYPYDDSGSHGYGTLAGIFAAPLVLVLLASIAAVCLRRAAPIAWSLVIGVLMIVALFALDLVAAHASFQGAG